MFLLKPATVIFNFPSASYLHSTMFLLKLHGYANTLFWFRNLHSTMFLLKRISKSRIYKRSDWFTFHNVSIKTRRCYFRGAFSHLFTFHNVSIKTEYQIKTTGEFTFHNVSIKTNAPETDTSTTTEFTFHNVSIKTRECLLNRDCLLKFTFHNVSIKTDLEEHAGRSADGIYIPQCFY